MPPVFPGVDPLLEGQMWESFLTQFCSEVARVLTPAIGSRYIALVEKGLVLDTLDDISITMRDIRPDVTLVGEMRDRSGAAAVLEPPMRLVAPMEEEVPIHFVEIREVGSMTVITVIEVMSPSNKRGEGRTDYLHKRRSILNSEVNLVEIDLLRGGARVPMREALPNSDYFVLVHREKQRPVADVWNLSLRDRLPVIPIPLLRPDKEAELDLQRVFNETYDSIGYGRALDYSRELTPPVSSDDAAWVSSILVKAETV